MTHYPVLVSRLINQGFTFKLFFFKAILCLFIFHGCIHSLSPIEKTKQSLTHLPEYSIILADMKIEGVFFTQYFHQYRIINQDSDTKTNWLSVSKDFYQANQLFLGMVIFGKTEGREVESVSPPGYQYVGNRRYGHWRQTIDGCTLWEFYGKYVIFNSIYGAIAEIDRDEFSAYQRAVANKVPYFGNKNQYGTNGSRTSLFFPEYYQRQQQETANISISSGDPFSRYFGYQPITLIDPRPEGENIHLTLLDRGLSAFLTITLFLLLFFIGGIVGNWLYLYYHYNYTLAEAVEKGSLAIGIALSGYYLALLFSLFGPVSTSSGSFAQDIMDLAVYGLSSIIWLNISNLIYHYLLLRGFEIKEMILCSQNVSAGFISAGINLGSGLIIYGVITGSSGASLWYIIGYWAAGLTVFMLAGYMHDIISPYNLYEEIQHGNTAVGIHFFGIITSMGMVIGLSAQHTLYVGTNRILSFIILTLISLILLPVIRFLIKHILLFKDSFSDNILQPEQTNTGTACIEAALSIIAVFILFWCI